MFILLQPKSPLYPLDVYSQLASNSSNQQQFKRNLYMMDSMTDDELDGKVSNPR